MGEATITTPTEREIHIERVFDAPIARVWQAYGPTDASAWDPAW